MKYIFYYKTTKFTKTAYLKNIEMENKSEFVQISKIDHDNFYKSEKVKEVLIGSVKIDISSKDKIKEIKTSKKEKESHVKQVVYYIFYLNKYYGLSIKKGELLYPKIKKKIPVSFSQSDYTEMELVTEDIIKISETDKNHFQVESKNKCKNCAFFDLCHI